MPAGSNQGGRRKRKRWEEKKVLEEVGKRNGKGDGLERSCSLGTLEPF